MHRDQKIGLSLAVLIIGFAGAFCFRNEPPPEPHPLSLKHSAQLDARIEHLPIRAYTGRDGSDGLVRPSETPETEAPLVDASALEEPAERMSIDRDESGNLLDLFASIPEPLAPEFEPIETHPHANVSEANQTALESDRPDPLPTPAEQTSPANLPGHPVRTERSYVVTSGDTLSGIALKMYGTTARYLDIYRANTDALDDPDELPVGAVLRIP